MPVVVDPEMGLVTRADVLNRRPTLDVREPSVDELPGVLASEEAVSFITGIKTWRDSYLDSLSQGDWVATVGAGYDPYPVEAFANKSVTFTHCPGVSAQQVAEHVFSMALSFSRCLWTFRDRQTDRTWEEPPDGLTDLAGDICTIVGLGSIGEAVASRARAFDMNVRGVKRSVDGYDGAAHEVFTPDVLLEALSGAGMVVLSVPLTEETRGLVGADELSQLAQGSILVNVSRGAVLRMDPLLNALDKGPLAAAGLDVTDPEPLPPDSPLWAREDVLVTPHCAGTSTKYAQRFLDRYVEQYDRWIDGDPLLDQPI